jgi:hypothetical protein
MLLDIQIDAMRLGNLVQQGGIQHNTVHKHTYPSQHVQARVLQSIRPGGFIDPQAGQLLGGHVGVQNILPSLHEAVVSVLTVTTHSTCTYKNTNSKACTLTKPEYIHLKKMQQINSKLDINTGRLVKVTYGSIFRNKRRIIFDRRYRANARNTNSPKNTCMGP